MPIFLTQTLGAPVYILGIIEGTAEGLSSLLKTVFGFYSDKTGKRRPFVFSGYLSSAFSKLIIASAYCWPIAFIGRLIDKFGKGLRTGARDAMLLESTKDDNRGFIFGVHRSLDTTGAVVGPLIALLLIQLLTEDIRYILYLAVIPAFISLLLLIFVKECKKKHTAIKISFSLSLKNASGQFKRFLIVLALFSLGNSSDTFLILRAKSLGLSMTALLLAYSLYNLTYAVFSIPAGRISDKIGAKKVFLAGLIIYSSIYLAFAINKIHSIVWLLFAIYGLYIAATDGVSKALAGSFIDKKEAATAYGVMQTVISICTLLASIIGGFLWSAIRPEATFIFGSACALTASVFFLANKKKVTSAPS